MSTKQEREEKQRAREEYKNLLLIEINSLPDNTEEKLRKEIELYLFEDNWQGAADKTVEFILRNNRIYTIRSDVASSILYYSEKKGIYEEEGATRIREFLERIFSRNYSLKLASLVTDRIKNRTYIESEEFYRVRDAWKITCVNGEIDLREAKLHAFNPDGYHTISIPITFDAGAQCNEIDKFVESVMLDQKDRDAFYELAGYLLFRGMPHQHIFFFVNAGGGGKGQALQLLTGLVGHKNICGITLKRLSTSNFASSRKKNKLLNAGGDINGGKIVETGEIKTGSGDDYAEIEAKFKPSETVQLFAKDVYAANELPYFEDVSVGMMRRPILFMFDKRFVSKEEYTILEAQSKTQNVSIKIDRIAELLTSNQIEMSGFLNKAIQGLNRLTTQGRFSNALTPDEMRVQYLRRSDTVSAFFTEVVDVCSGSDDDFIDKDTLYQCYSRYCGILSSAPKTPDFFFKFISKSGNYSETRESVEGIRKRGYRGINSFFITEKLDLLLKKPENGRGGQGFPLLVSYTREKKEEENNLQIKQEGKKVGQGGQLDIKLVRDWILSLPTKSVMKYELFKQFPELQEEQLDLWLLKGSLLSMDEKVFV